MLSDLLNTKHILFGINAKNKKHLFLELSSKSELLNKQIEQKTTKQIDKANEILEKAKTQDDLDNKIHMLNNFAF